MKKSPTKATANSKSQNAAQSFIQSDTTNQSDSRKGCDSILLVLQEDQKLKPRVHEYNYRNSNTTDTKFKPTEINKAIKVNLSLAPNSSRIDCKYNLIIKEFIVSKINSKVYIIIINKLFKYLKKVLSSDLYNDIKRNFSENVNKCINKSNLYILREDESQSSIFNYIKSDETNVNNNERILKMSYDFALNKDKPVKIERKAIANKRNYSVCKVQSEGKNETNINQNHSQSSNTINAPVDNTNVNTSKQIKQSLYNLTKSRVTVLNTPNVPQSDRNQSKFKKNHINYTQGHQGNSIRSKKYKVSSGHNYINTTNAQLNRNNISGLNGQPTRVNITHYYSQNKDRKADMIITSDKSIEIKTIKRNKRKTILMNNKLCSKINSKNKNEISIETYDYYSNNIERGGSGSKTQRSSRSANSNKKSSESYSKVNSKLPSFIFPNQQHNYNYNNINNNVSNNNNDTVKKIRTQYIDLTRSDDHTLTPKNDEMMKLIKLSLDDNLKLMFNFSYEQFLSKESENLSKKSQEGNELSAEIEKNDSKRRKKSKNKIDYSK